jgi:hypothetical protein
MRRRDARGKAEYDRSVAGGGMEKLAERLEQRIAARESALAARERDVQAKLDELRAAKAATEDDLELRRRERLLADREAELGRRADAVTKRDLELAERADELAARERELAAKEEELASRAAPGTAAAGDGAYNLLALERLVEERGREFPDRVEEWTSYLFFLRDYAASDGTVPASFDRLIQDTFADLVA